MNPQRMAATPQRFGQLPLRRITGRGAIDDGFNLYVPHDCPAVGQNGLILVTAPLWERGPGFESVECGACGWFRWVALPHGAPWPGPGQLLPMLYSPDPIPPRDDGHPLIPRLLHPTRKDTYR